MIRKLVAFVILAVSMLAPSTQLCAAQDTTTRFNMERITFKGTRLYTDERLLAALGMRIGGSYSQQDLQDSANKLSNSGMFAQVSYRFTATTAQYDLIDNPRLFPVKFDNMVWMDEEKLLSTLMERTPFFIGKVSEEGTLASDLCKQIESVLAEKGVAATVQNALSEVEGQPSIMTYSVLDPRIQIALVTLPGLSPDMATKLDPVLKKMVGGEYTRHYVQGMQDVELKPLFDENGYLNASFGEPSVKLLSGPANTTAKVELTLVIEQGAQYRIGALSIRGDDPVAKEAAKQIAAFKTGQVVNMKMFLAEVSRLGSDYVKAGHMGAKVKAYPTFDENAKTVSFNIEMIAGDTYKLSKLDLLGLDDAQKSRLLPIWKLNAGDVYDPAYASSFLEKNRSKLGFLNGYSLAWSQKINDENKTVELSVFFRKPLAK